MQANKMPTLLTLLKPTLMHAHGRYRHITDFLRAYLLATLLSDKKGTGPSCCPTHSLRYLKFLASDTAQRAAPSICGC